MKPFRSAILLFCAIALVAGSAFAAPQTTATSKQVGLDLSAGYPFIFDGDIGGGLRYDRAFKEAVSLRGDLTYDYNSDLRLQGGLAAFILPGDTFAGAKFDSMEVVTATVGTKLFLPKTSSPARFFLLGDVGLAYIPEVKYTEEGTKYDLYKNTLTWTIDFGAGFEYPLNPKLSLFADGRFVVVGEPRVESGNDKADYLWLAPISIGVRFGL